MASITISELIPVLQVAIGPVILVSGIGLLLLTMTNRLARVVDRSRSIARELQADPHAERLRRMHELQILSRRTRVIRRAIWLASFSVLLAAVLVIVLFVSTLWELEGARLAGALFIGCMFALVGSVITFIADVNQSLAALGLELADVGLVEDDGGAT